MTADHPTVTLLRSASALRAAVHAAFVQASPRGDFPISPYTGAAAGRILVDDLCRLASFADALDVSDAALACAATDPNPALSWAARNVYDARLRLRAAGFAAQAPRANGKAFCAETRANLGAAFDAVRDAGWRVVCVPRHLLDNVNGLAVSPSQGVLRRLLAAAYSTNLEDLVAVLGAPPYSIDPANLRAGFARARAGSAREMLGVAIAGLRGSQARDAALAAAADLDTARINAENENFSLTSAVESLAQALAGRASSEGTTKRDPEYEMIQRGATEADRVWASASGKADPAVRVSSLLDGLASAQPGNGLTLIPYGCADASGAAIRFEDAPSAAIAWESFATALDIARNGRTGPPGEQQLLVSVAMPLARAAAEYLLESAPPGRQRAWPQPESPATLTAPPMTFSASRLNAYVKCPRRWFYEYMCEALEDVASLHAAYGRVVHDALEALHREVRVPSRHDPSLILERLLRDLDVAFGKARPDFSSQLEYEVSRCRARRMAEQYVRWLTAEAARAPLEIVSVELLQRRRLGDHDFIGYIDRIDKPLAGGPVTIFDYKTGRIDPDAQEYLEKVRRGDEAQLALYYAMRRAEGDEIARIALVSIRDPRDDVWILALDLVDDGGMAIVEHEPRDGVLRATCSRADLDASLAALLARCDFLTKQGLDHFPAGEDPPCNFCAYARACRERPIEGERIFAR